ncbi:hypothetical protein C8J27_11266 [Rhodobacter aestuarii]|uniref:Glycosyltransferase n=1 Tax=Rhodobacter aestuarii TaxID=453582 RepID=A0A1N7Q9M5_9RHOB|nr:glycosyltransferase [Rhodobacter aestuarii]PTV93785.1 hypothetical protein C8J27_11266 [Rhodobacter aestuarii]SIT19516.1 hypothetical protein SAMN05421580_11466 [Rhodobacter aestuarii]
MERVVLCMKWGTLYGPEYVNVLYNACRANLTGPFRFVCLTDDAAGLVADIEVFPIPEIGLAPDHWRGGAWPKISVFCEDLYGLKGRALFIDLDMVIWGELDQFFEYGTGLVAIDSAPWRYRDAPPQTMSSIFAFDLGKMGWLVDWLRADREHYISKYGIEQRYLHGEVPQIGYWPQDWIKSYKYHLRRPLLVDRLMGPAKPHPSLKVLCFHGKPRPIDLIHPPKGNWDRFPHYGRGQVPWMAEYWARYGGTV